MSGRGAVATSHDFGDLRGADRWVADRVEYVRIPDFLDADECRRLIEVARAASAADAGALEPVAAHNPWLIEVDARLCSLLGFAPGAGTPLRARYFKAGEQAPSNIATREAPWRCSVSIYLNDVESAGEVRLGRSNCVLRPRRGSALIAKRTAASASDPRSEPQAITNVFAALIALGPGAAGSHVLHPISMLFGAGLGLLTATIFIYAAAAMSFLTGVALGEFFSRGALVGVSAGANLIIMSAIPWLPIGFGPTVFIILLLALIPPIAANRFYQRVLGALGWVLPLNYLMLPLGVLLFVVAAPFAIAAAPAGGVRWDWLTWTVETSGGFVLTTFARTAFNIGNFTFIPGAPTSFATAGVSAHETGHTLNGSAFGGFFYWIGAVDENVPPLMRGAAAHSEMLADGHFGGVGGPSIPMW